MRHELSLPRPAVFSALSSHADWTWLGPLGLPHWLTLFSDCLLLTALISPCLWSDYIKVKLKFTLRLMVSQSVCKSWCRAADIYILLFDSYGLVFVGCPLWWEDESVFCTCCWPLPAQSFSGPNPLPLATIFYCLRFETSLFVASYDLQGHGGGIRPRLHMGLTMSECSPPWSRFLAHRLWDTLSNS
jgi:hypothetical protein